jgi:hypothetical protein
MSGGAAPHFNYSRDTLKRCAIRVTSEFLEEVKKQMADAARLAADKPLLGLCYTGNQIHGRINYVRWINAGEAVVGSDGKQQGQPERTSIA